MAQVPELTVPSVPQSAAPTPGQSINAPAEAFGGTQLAAGLADASKATGQAGDALYDYAGKVQTLYNAQVAATRGYDTAQKVGQAYAAWKENHTEDAAVATFPDFQKQVTGIVQDGLQGLSPVAARDYQDLAQRYARSFLIEGAGYAAAQGTLGRINAADKNAIAAAQLYGSSQADPDGHLEAGMLQQAAASAHQFFSTAGLQPDDPQIIDKIKSYVSPAYEAKISAALSAGDVDTAGRMIQQHSGDMTLQDLRAVQNAYRTANLANDVQSTANAMYEGGKSVPSSGQASAATPESLWASIKTQESHNQPGVTGPETPYGQAQGLTQMLPATAQAMAEKLGLPWRPELMTEKTPEAAAYQEQLGHAYFQQGLEANNGDLRKAAEYYYGGPDTSKWGPKTNAYADQVIARAGGASGGAEVAFAPIPKPGPTTNVDEWLASTTTTLWQRAQQAFPDNAAMAQRTYEAAMQRAHMDAQVVDEGQKANYDNLEGLFTSGKVTSTEDIQKQFPSQWAALPPKYQHALQSTVDNTNTYERSEAYTEELGRYSAAKGAWGDKSLFIGDDIRSMNLTIGQKQSLIAKQDEVKNARTHEQQTDTVVQRAMNSPDGKNAVQALGLMPPTGPLPPKYYQFQGALEEEVEAYRASPANNGRDPQDADLRQIIARVTAKVGNARAYEVPPDEAAKIRAAAAAQGLNYGDADVGRIWAQSQRIRGVLQ
jgi:hypothetical protein